MRLQSREYKNFIIMAGNIDITRKDRISMVFLVLIVIIAGTTLGLIVYFFLEYILGLILIIPGFIAFFGEALKNGGNIN